MKSWDQITSELHARDGLRQRCPWCRAEMADENDYAIASDNDAGGAGPWLCWSDPCEANDADAQRERAEKAESRIAELEAEIARSGGGK